LNGTFGRRIYMEGTTLIGFFKGDGSKLHGYGEDYNSNQKGLF